MGEQAAQSLQIANPRQIAERDLLIGEQRGGERRQRRVLAPLARTRPLSLWGPSMRNRSMSSVLELYRFSRTSTGDAGQIASHSRTARP